MPPASTRVSVLVCTRDQASFLKEALDSALAQDLAPGSWEVLVIDDGSTDGTPEILKSYGGRIRSFRSPPSGLAAACNRGIAEARGAWLARLDSDDSVSPSWLRRMLDAAERGSGAVCATCDRYELHPDGRRERVEVSPGDIYKLIACGSLFRTEALRRVGGLRPLYWEEYDLYLRLRPLGAFVHVPEPLYHYRRHPDGMTADPSRHRQGWRELLESWGARALLDAGSDSELKEEAERVSKGTRTS